MFKETSVLSSICVPEPDGALTNSIAVPPEFTAKNLLAVKDEGVSVKFTNVLDPELDGALTNSIAVPPEFTAKNLLAVKDEGVSVKLTNVLEPPPPPLNKLPF